MKAAVKNKNTSPDKLPEYDRGLMALDRGDFAEALQLLLSSSRHWTANDIKRNDLMTALLGTLELSLEKDGDAKKKYAKMLMTAIDWFPHTPQALERVEKLEDLSEDLQDESLREKSGKLALEIGDGLLKNKNTLKDTELAAADIYVSQARAYTLLKDNFKAKESYKRAADEYLKSIKSTGQDVKSERAYNLERAYCLWKAGDFDQSTEIYLNLEKKYPEEFTFYYQHGRMLQEKKEWSQALEKAQLAFKFSYGDNKLRVTQLIGETYKNLGQSAAGVKILDQVLSEYKVPEGKAVRTAAYLAKLKKLEG